MHPTPAPLTILVIDDDETVLESLRAQLRRGLGAGVFIDAVSSGEEALSLADEYVEDGVPVPVILCDEIMPGMRGHAVLRELHGRLPDSRTILLTGQADLSSVTAAVNHAALYQYIAKPWEQVDLLLTVRGALDAWRTEQDRRRRLEVFHSFVPEPFLRMLGLADPVETTLGLARESELTVLFADVRNFTALSEELGSTRTFEFLNACFDVLVPIIVEHGGVVDKYIGDALLALFPEPGWAADAAQALVAAAADIRLDGRDDAPPVRLGVGLNTGHLILGTVGVPERLQTTVIGDVVNTAARIEALTKDLLTPALLAEETARRIPHDARYVGSFSVPGKGAPVRLHQLVCALVPEERAAVTAGRQRFDAILAGLDDRPLAASEALLADYVEAFPEDRLAAALGLRLHRLSTRAG